MPLIMDDGIDMDDLFGDEPIMALAQVPPAKGLVQRVEEMRLTGCCTKLACSKLGHIAYITRDRTAVILRNHICNPEDGKWKLSKEYPIQQIRSLHEGCQLEHLSWNHAGTDLAVTDSMGRISIFNMAVVSNQMSPSRSCLADQEDDLSAIAGLFWLNPERSFPLHRPVTQVEGQYQYIGPSTKALGPFHPQSIQTMSALISVTRGASIRFLSQQRNGEWLETITELESLATSDDMISHASFCSDRDNTLLVMVRTAASCYRLYRLSINWNIPAEMDLPHLEVLPHPTVTVRPLKTVGLNLEDAVVPSPSLHDAPRPQPQLSSLELISPAPHAKNVDPTYPIVMAIFTHVPVDSQDEREAFSTIVRWEIRSVPMKLHGSFDQLSSKRNNANSANVQALDFNRLDSEVENRVVIGVQQLSSHTVISLAYSDGTIEFRDRSTWAVMKRDDDFERVSGMTQVGFVFPKSEPCLHTVLSPNYCLAIHLDAEGSASLRTMEYTHGSLSSREDGQFRAVIAALTMSFVYSCMHHNNIDDVLMVIQPLSSPDLNLSFLSELHVALSLSVDHSIDPIPQKIFRNLVLQRCLSMQNSLGYSGESTEGSKRTLAAKVAWATLHLRGVSLLFALTFNSGAKPGGGGGDSDFTRPEILQSLTGIIRYSIDMISYIVDSLTEIAPLLTSPITPASLHATLQSLNTPALTLLLASVPRTFLRHNCRALRGLLAASTKSLPSSTSIPRRQAFTTVINLIEISAAVKVVAFERVAGEIEASVRAAYQDAGTSEADRQLAERELLLRSDVPAVMMPVVEKLMKTTVVGLREEIDPSALYFKDLSWLGLGDDRRTRAFETRHRVDAIRKEVVSVPPQINLGEAGRVEDGEDMGDGHLGVGGRRWRRCTRCCAYMEEMPPGTGAGRDGKLEIVCFCGSMWMAV